MRMCFRFLSGVSAFFQLRNHQQMSTTSLMKTSHSANQPQKNTRSSEPMANGANSEVESQMPTPVIAPTVVVTMNTMNVMRYASRSMSGRLFLCAHHSIHVSSGEAPTARG